MGSWADVTADFREKQWDLILPSASLISLLPLSQQNGSILSLRFSDHTKTTENYPVAYSLFCFYFFFFGGGGAGAMVVFFRL